MTDFSANVKQPTLGGAVAPVYNTCTTADKFAASTGKYRLHYKNGATVTGTLFINKQGTAPTPVGSVPVVPAGATRWDDVRVTASLAGTSELAIYIPDISQFVDATGFVNLQHTTPTTLTVAIEGPI